MGLLSMKWVVKFLIELHKSMAFLAIKITMGCFLVGVGTDMVDCLAVWS